jgi:putative membrane protein
MRRQFFVFLIRWVLNSFGLWLGVELLGTTVSFNSNGASIFGFLLAGFIFSIINTILRPILVILSLPAILITLGLFMFVVNGVLVYLSVLITPGISMTFFDAILTGMLLSLINYILSTLLEARQVSAAQER